MCGQAGSIKCQDSLIHATLSVDLVNQEEGTTGGCGGKWALLYVFNAYEAVCYVAAQFNQLVRNCTTVTVDTVVLDKFQTALCF